MSKGIPREDHRHGTPAGAAAHVRAGEAQCDACRAAKAAYDERRRTSSMIRIRDRATAQAQSRALRRLKQAHPGEYRGLYLDEQTKIRSEQSL